MPRDDNRLLPAAYQRWEHLHIRHDGGAEHGAVHHGADGAVGGLPHFGQPVLLHALSVGGDGGTFDRHAKPAGGVRRVPRDAVLRALAFRQSQVVIFRFQFDKGRQQLVLDHPPEDTGHLVPVHLHQRCFHLYFVHAFLPSCVFRLTAAMPRAHARRRSDRISPYPWRRRRPAYACRACWSATARTSAVLYSRTRGCGS